MSARREFASEQVTVTMCGREFDAPAWFMEAMEVDGERVEEFEALMDRIERDLHHMKTTPRETEWFMRALRRRMVAARFMSGSQAA